MRTMKGCKRCNFRRHLFRYKTLASTTSLLGQVQVRAQVKVGGDLRDS